MKQEIIFCILFSLFIFPLNTSADEIYSSEGQAEEEKISLDLKDVDIVELLRIISLKTGKTVVASKEVSGRITIYLNNVVFKDVLDIVLLTQGLACEKKGDIFYVMPGAEYRRLYGKDYTEPRELKTIKLQFAKPSNVFNAISQLKSDIGKIVADEASGTIILIDIPEKLDLLGKSIQELDRPLQTKIFDLNYVKSADAKTQLSAAITSGTGEVIIDERNGKAIVSDLPQKMEKIGQLIKEIDEETRQVFLETNIIEVDLNDLHQRGIDWEKLFSERSQDSLDFKGYFPMTLSFYQQMSVGTLAANNYKLILNALETYGNVKTISQPRIAVVNNEEAKILVGKRDAYVTTSTSQTSGSPTVTSESVEFVDVGVKLKVVPTINKEGFITMKIKPEVSSAGDPLVTGTGNKIPIISTSEAETVVKVKDGSMIMIGGLKKEKKRDSRYGFPVLGRIPIINIFFSRRERESTYSELIIFITPRLTRGISPLEGTEPEKNIPREIMPKAVKNKLVREEAMDQLLSAKIQRAQKKQKRTDEIEKVMESKKENSLKYSQSKLKKDRRLNPRFKLAEENYKKSKEAQNDGGWGEAIEYARKAVILDATYVEAYNQLGILYESNAENGLAKQMYLKAIEIDADYLPAYYNLAALSEAQKNTEEALRYWRKRAELGDLNDSWTQEALNRIKNITMPGTK